MKFLKELKKDKAVSVIIFAKKGGSFCIRGKTFCLSVSDIAKL